MLSVPRLILLGALLSPICFSGCRFGYGYGLDDDSINLGGAPPNGDGDLFAGDGDGDSATGDGDGLGSTSGDGDGDTASGGSGDGDGDTGSGGSGDGDGDTGGVSGDGDTGSGGTSGDGDGDMSTGGSDTGGAGTGGAGTGGAGTGGAGTGGAGTGGAGTGGAGTGGAGTGGAGTGGAGTGGAGTGGAGTGGAGTGGSGGTVYLEVTNETDVFADGDGLSLREAVDQAVRDGASGTPHTITFHTSVTSISLGSVLPRMTSTLSISGNGATLDFTGHTGSGACLMLDAPDIVIENLEVFGCGLEPVFSAAGATSGIQILNNHFHDNADPVTVDGDGALVQNNLIETSGTTCLSVKGPNSVVRDNEVYDCTTDGIYFDRDADNLTVVGNVVVRSGGMAMVLSGLSTASIWFNTIVVTGNHGISIGTSSSIDVRNNILTDVTNNAISGSAARFSALDYNLYFNNGTNCAPCAVGPNFLDTDPQFTAAGSDDYAPITSSPAVNSGVDVGEDRNGAGSGNFDGAAPDRGAFEVN